MRRTIFTTTIIILLLNIIKGQDTLYNRIDTILCVSTLDDLYFDTPYDTSIFSSNWIEIEQGDTISIMDSIKIENIDSLLLISKPTNSSEVIFFDTIFFELRLFPTLKFNIPQPECYNGDTLIIKDNSSYEIDYTEVSYYDSSGTPLVVKDSLIKSYVDNGDTVLITANYSIDECSVNVDSTLLLTTKLQPTLSIDFEKTCENEFLKIKNLSINNTQGALYHFTINDQLHSFYHDTQFNLVDTIPDGNYTVSIKVDNVNGCLDSATKQITIDSVTYVFFDGLKNSYCAFQDKSELLGNINGGSFNGLFINDLGDGSALFEPITNASNVQVNYSYTNDFLCTDIHTELVDIVYPKPDLKLNNLLAEYCAQDMASDLSINKSDGISDFEVLLNNSFFDNSNDFFYSFNPITPGNYQIRNYYEDINGCRDTITSSTTVHPLPVVDLDSLKVLAPGESILIGNTATIDPKVQFLWSNGSTFPFIEVNQPGIYILEGINSVTGCSATDTIKMEYNFSVESILTELRIFPNPTMDKVSLLTSKQINGISVVNVYGEEVSFDGYTKMSTDLNGELHLDFTNKLSGYYYILIPKIGNFLVIKL